MKTQFKCFWCPKSHSRIGQWVIHTRLEYKYRENRICPSCGKYFKHSYQMGMHLLRRECLHEFPKDQCKYCDKLFTSRSYVRKHEYVCLSQYRQTYKDVCLSSFIVDDGSDLFTKKQADELDMIELNI
jgi:hypothetical protein